MKHLFTRKFVKEYHKTPKVIQEKFDKQLSHLLSDFRYPSLHVKKYDEERGIWQARVNGGYRFYFITKNDFYILLEIRKHP